LKAWLRPLPLRLRQAALFRLRQVALFRRLRLLRLARAPLLALRLLQARLHSFRAPVTSYSFPPASLALAPRPWVSTCAADG